VDSITSFSAKPLVLIFYTGAVILICSFVLSLLVFYRKLFLGIAMGWTSIILSLWFFGGLILFSIGVVGIYLSKVFEQAK